MGLFGTKIFSCGYVKNQKDMWIYFINNEIVFNAWYSTKNVYDMLYKGKISFNSITSAKCLGTTGSEQNHVMYIINNGAYTFVISKGCELHVKLAMKFE